MAEVTFPEVKDRNVATPSRVRIKKPVGIEDNEVFDVEAEPGTVYEEGTPLNEEFFAALKNYIDNNLGSPDNPVPIENGGTGANTAEGARTNLDVYSKGEVDEALERASSKIEPHINTRVTDSPEGVHGFYIDAQRRIWTDADGDGSFSEEVHGVDNETIVYPSSNFKLTVGQNSINLDRLADDTLVVIEEFKWDSVTREQMLAFITSDYLDVRQSAVSNGNWSLLTTQDLIIYVESPYKEIRTKSMSTIDFSELTAQNMLDFEKSSYSDVSTWANNHSLYIPIDEILKYNDLEASKLNRCLGETMPVKISGYGTVNTFLIGLNHDDITSGGKAAMTFACDDSFGRGNVYSNDSVNGWTQWSVFQKLSSNIINAMQSDVKAHVPYVNKRYLNSSSNLSSSAVVSVRGFVPARIEVTGNNDNPSVIEGTQYEYFKNGGKLSSIGDTGWTRTIKSSSYIYSTSLSSMGEGQLKPWSSTAAYLVFFCIN